jgi:acyl-CoA thioester hydrolase
MEMILIESQLIQYTDNILVVEMKMWNETETELKAILWIKFVHYNVQTKKVANHSEELIRLFESAVLPVEQQIFENRSLEIVKTLKLKANA